MTTPGIDRRLLDLFTAEVRERSSALERALLSIDSAEEDEKHRLQSELLKIAHSLKGAAGLVEIRPVEALCHRMEDLISQAQGEGRILSREELDLLLSATDSISEAGALLAAGKTVPPGHGTDASPMREEAAPTTAYERPLPHTVPRSTDLDGSVRISGDRLDALLHRSGELLASDGIIRSRAEEVSALRDAARELRAKASADAGVLENGLRELSARLIDDRRRFHSTVTALKQEVRKARMQPFSEACLGLRRIIRDITEASGKIATLEIRGGDLEIDRSVLSGLQDALRHLVRNAVVHGIETPDERRAAGKPDGGTIVVSASLAGDRMQVRVEDDGRGFDLDALRAASRKADLAGDEKQLLRHLFEPGMTTSRVVTEYSGRGVGLEIVRAAAERMRGMVTAAHAPGKGAVFTLTVPLTLATVRALEIVAGDLPFAIDVASVQRITRIAAEDIRRSDGRMSFTEHGREIPVLDLAAWLELPASPSRPRHLPAVLVGPRGAETAVLVDEVCGELELLARSLGPRLENVRHYSGATVLPDGRIALLLNVSALAEAAEDGEKTPMLEPLAPVPVSRRVLVVDDSPSIRTLLKLVLEAADYEVATAADGALALDYLRHHQVDAVVADVDMPSMDGYALIEAVRRSRDFGSLPVILVTGRGTPEDRERGQQAGATAYMTKEGFDRQQFLEIVGQIA